MGYAASKEFLSTEEIESGYILEAAFASMSVVYVAMIYWLGRFVLEAKVISGIEYSPDSLSLPTLL